MKGSHIFWLSRSKGMTVDIWIWDYNPPRCFQKKISGRGKHNECEPQQETNFQIGGMPITDLFTNVLLITAVLEFVTSCCAHFMLCTGVLITWIFSIIHH
jgi:hypothetical protein